MSQSTPSSAPDVPRWKITVIWYGGDDTTNVDTFTTEWTPETSVQVMSDRRGVVRLVNGTDQRGLPVTEVIYARVSRITRRPM